MQEQWTASWTNLADKLTGWGNSFILYLPNILVAVLTFIIAYWLSKKIHDWVYKRLKNVVSQATIRSLFANLSSIIIITLGLISALSVLNLDVAVQSLLAGAGVAGLTISLALQGILTNAFSGVFLAVNDEINVGDWIETNGYKGTVLEVETRHTKIIEADNNIVVIPNKTLLNNPFKNYSLTHRIRTTIQSGVSYDSDLEQVKQTATDAIEALFPSKDEESVEFYYTEFADSSINFVMRFWVNGTTGTTALEVKSNAIMKVKEKFNEKGIEIPYPIRTLVQKSI